MNTHENRALFSKAVLKATICIFLAAGASVSQAFAFSEVTETMRSGKLYSKQVL